MSWDELYAILILETGWTWEYIDEEMTVPRMSAFREIWKETPPLRVALAGLLSGIGGWSPSPSAGTASSKKGKPGIDQYLSAFGGAGFQLSKEKVVG